MAENNIDVFISYKKEERDKAESVAQALEQAGYVAVADFTSIEVNEDFAEKIDYLIRSARLVLVLWTHASAASSWVRKEAALAVDLDTYLGVLVEPADLRVDLRPIQKIDVSAEGLDAGLPRLIAEVRNLLGAGVVSPAEAERLSAEHKDELLFFRRIEAIATVEAYSIFLEAFPAGRLRELAEAQALTASPAKNEALQGAMRQIETLKLEQGQLSDRLDSRAKHVEELEKALRGAEAKLGKTQSELVEIMARAESTAEANVELEEIIAKHSSDKSALKKELASSATSKRPSRSTVSDDSGDTLSKTYVPDMKISDLGAKNLTSTAKRMSVSPNKRRAAPMIAALLVSLVIGAAGYLVLWGIPTKEVAMQPNCRIDGEDGIEILGECRALSTTSLFLSNTQVADAAPLSGLTSLTWLYLSNTQVADAAPLSGLTSLATLDLGGTQVADAAPLAGLTSLTSLYLGNTQVADAAPLSRLRSLKRLFLAGTEIEDLGPLRTLTNLHYLGAPDGTRVGDVTNDTRQTRKAVADYIAAHSK